MKAAIAAGVLLVAPSVRAEEASFEAIVAAASDAGDLNGLGGVVGAFVDDCARARRELDRSRCRVVKGFLQRALSERSYVLMPQEPGLVESKGADAPSKTLRLSISGCVACMAPVDLGGGERRFLTLRPPEKAGDLAAATVMKETLLAFDTAEEAASWGEQAEGRLRVRFVARPTTESWRRGSEQGVLWKPLAVQIYDRCSGSVLFSDPPAKDRKLPVSDTDGCPSQ